MIETPNSKDWIWDSYWQFDRIASCFDTAGSNYPPEFEAEWTRFFETLPKEAKILDLCTGNGAISRMAAKYSARSEKSFEITGVDRARINPDKFVEGEKNYQSVTYLGEVSVEDLPFEDTSFDAVISQYGFEYADQARATKETARVLKPGGAGKLICHASEGTPAAQGRVEVKNISLVVDGLTLFTLAKKATTAVWKTEKGTELSASDREIIAAFGAAMKKLESKIEKDQGNQFFQATHGLLQHTFGARAHFPLNTLLDKIEDTKTETLAHLGLVQALLDASLTKENSHSLLVTLKDKGFGNIKHTPFTLENGTKLVGWNFEFRRLAP